MILAIVQARVSSKRLPDKVLKPILGHTMLSLEIERINRSIRIDKILIATSTDTSDDAIESICSQMKVLCFRGSLDDVLDRFYQATLYYKPDHIVRLTGDCPLIDPQTIDNVIDYYTSGNFDYVSNTLKPTFPDGLDVEIFSYAALETARKEASLPSQREHVTPYIYQHPDKFNIGSYEHNTDLSHMRWTVDKQEDFVFVNNIYDLLYPFNENFTFRDILDLLKSNPSLLEINSHIGRNEGHEKSLKQDDLSILENNGKD